MPITPKTEHGVWHQLRIKRTDTGRSLTDLHRETGLSLSYLSDLERGRQLPSAAATRKLAKALNVPVSVLERQRLVDDEGNDIALRQLIRQIVREEIAAAGTAA